LTQVADIIQGLISASKGDFTGIKPLAKLIGGFPLDQSKLE